MSVLMEDGSWEPMNNGDFIEGKRKGWSYNPYIVEVDGTYKCDGVEYEGYFHINLEDENKEHVHFLHFDSYMMIWCEKEQQSKKEELEQFRKNMVKNYIPIDHDRVVKAEFCNRDEVDEGFE